MRNQISHIRAFDARGEAVYYVVNALRQHNVPLWVAYNMGYRLVDMYSEELISTKSAFDENPQSRSVLEWRIALHKYTMKLFHTIATGYYNFEKPTTWDNFSYSSYEHKNFKPTMEDKKIILPSMGAIEPNLDHDYKDVALFAVFDGHGGAECSDYCAAQFPGCITDIPLSSTDAEKLLPTAFENIDKRLNYICFNDDLKGGTTASVVLIINKTVHYAWVGDSGIGILRDKEIKQLTVPHTVDNPDEIKRVIEAGSEIFEIMGSRRVDGLLNITRAFGHPYHKKSICSIPDTGKFDIGDSDYLLFLASDGIWDFTTKEAILTSLVQFVKSNPPEEYTQMASYVGAEARTKSTDNVILLIVFLKPVAEVWEYILGFESE